MGAQLSLLIAKDRFKFSVSHMTIFPDGSKERLHGHNYQVELTIQYREGVQPMIPFSAFKTQLQVLCEQWDEHLLLPAKAKELVLEEEGPSLGFTLCGKRYLLPRDEVLLLPVENVTSEILARLFCENFCRGFRKQLDEGYRKALESVEVFLRETQGQGARYRMDF